MKRLIAFVATAAMIFGTATMTMASELDFYGLFRSAFSYVDNNDGTVTFEDTDNDDFYAYQRVRQYFDYVTNENLRAVVGYEIDSGWGFSGGDFSADNTNQVEIKRAMVDFNFPNTQFNVRSGIQGFALPGGAMGNPLLGGDMAGLIMNTPINDMLGLTFGWVRGYDFDDPFSESGEDNEYEDGDLDVFLASLPVTMDGFSFNPYFVYTNAEKKAMDSSKVGFGAFTETRLSSLAAGYGDNVQYTDDGEGFWLGSDFSVNMLDPISIKGQFIYGKLSADANVTDPVTGDTASGDVGDREGFYADFMADYNMDNMTPSFFALYSSGDDDDLSDGSETFPGLHSDGFVNPPVAGAFGFTGCQTSLSLARNYSFAQYVPQGIWKVGFALKNLTFMDKLSHKIGFAYTQGTHDKEVGEWLAANENYTAGWGNMTLTEDDSALEFTFTNEYQLYEALVVTLDYEYAKLDMDSDVWEARGGSDFRDEPTQQVTMGLCYSF